MSAGRSGYDPANPFAESNSGDLEAAQSSQAQRQRLLQGTASLEDGQRRLEESNRIALETEDLGADILRDLRGQREQIEHSRDTVSSNETYSALWLLSCSSSDMSCYSASLSSYDKPTTASTVRPRL